MNVRNSIQSLVNPVYKLVAWAARNPVKTYVVIAASSSFCSGSAVAPVPQQQPFGPLGALAPVFQNSLVPTPAYSPSQAPGPMAGGLLPSTGYPGPAPTPAPVLTSAPIPAPAGLAPAPAPAGLSSGPAPTGLSSGPAEAPTANTIAAFGYNYPIADVEALPVFLQALASGKGWKMFNTDETGAPVGDPLTQGPIELSIDVTQLNPDVKALVLSVLQEVSSSANFVFTQTTGPANLRFLQQNCEGTETGYASPPGMDNAAGNQSTIAWLGNLYTKFPAAIPNLILKGLGLCDPVPSQGGASLSLTGATLPSGGYAPILNNTVMAASSAVGSNGPQSLDLGALVALNGAAPGQTGNRVVVLDGSVPGVGAIYLNGNNNTLAPQSNGSVYISAQPGPSASNGSYVGGAELTLAPGSQVTAIDLSGAQVGGFAAAANGVASTLIGGPGTNYLAAATGPTTVNIATGSSNTVEIVAGANVTVNNFGANDVVNVVSPLSAATARVQAQSINGTQAVVCTVSSSDNSVSSTILFPNSTANTINIVQDASPPLPPSVPTTTPDMVCANVTLATPPRAPVPAPSAGQPPVSQAPTGAPAVTKSAGKAGVIAGSVAGGVAGATLLLGGAWALKRKDDKRKELEARFRSNNAVPENTP